MPPECRQQTGGKPSENERNTVEEKVYKEDAQRTFSRRDNHIQLSQRINQFTQSVNFFNQVYPSQNTENLTIGTY